MKKALLYKIRVTDGALDLVHGVSREIDELWISDVNICVNRETCFESDKPRARDTRVIMLEDHDVHVAIMMLSAKNVFEATFKRVFESSDI